MPPHIRILIILLAGGWLAVSSASAQSLDSDGDGLSDSVETGTGVFVSASNTGTDPNDSDTDNDGLADGTEVLNFATDPLAPNNVPFFTRVGDPGNPDDDFGVNDIENTGLGYVGQEFDIGMTEVTNYMYALFLNSVAKRDRLYGLYKQDMADNSEGGIIRRGAQGSYTYEIKPGFEGKPVNFVSLWDTLRYINWLHNWKMRDDQMRDAFRPTLTGAQDQDVSTTEDGAYQLRGTNPDTFIRHPEAKFFLPDVDEWHKAAYYDPDPGGSRPSESYWTAANQTMSTLQPSTSPLHAVGTAAGPYLGSSHYGTYDQDGNVKEWTQNALVLGGRTATSSSEEPFSGFRVARAAEETTVPGWDFVYELKHVNEAAADAYVVSSSNVRKYSEWQSPPVTYWGPSANGVDASLTFRFPFAKAASRVSLRADLASFNFAGGGGLGSGSCSLWASKDGVNYELLLDNPTPSRIDSYKTFDADLPTSLLGSAELWVQVRFRVEGAPNASYTDAQFCRSSSAAMSPVFAVRADYGGPPSIDAPPLMVQIGEPGNLADEEYARKFSNAPIGALNYTFQMGAYEVTNLEYARFLEAKAKVMAVESIYRLYDARMGSDSLNGGITRKDNGDGTYSYVVKPDMARKPVVYVSIFSAMRYCNWLHNGGGVDSDMEAGAYRLLGNIPTDTAQLTRNATARYYLPNAEEFYKAAYYDPSTNANTTFGYWKFATRSDLFDPSNNSNTLADVDFSSQASYFGTYGQSGNVGYVDPGSGANTPAPKPAAANTGELLEESANTDDESATRTFRIAAAAGMATLRPLEDADGDGLKNGWEVLGGLDPYDNGTDNIKTPTPNDGNQDNGAAGDPDKDGLTNLQEQTLRTYPEDADTDNDGLTDGAEVNNGTDPKKADTDGDGLTDGAELNEHGTNPKKADTDGDGLSDGAEVNRHTTDPNKADTDGDGLNDGAEVNTHGTDPNKADTDGDVMPDKWEVDNSFNPTSASDAAFDTDGDGLTNLREFQLGANPRKADTDGDGMRDGWEVQYTLNPLVDDAAGDADSDTLTNLREFQLGTNPRNADTDGDGMPDYWEDKYSFDPLGSSFFEQGPDGDWDSDDLVNLQEFLRGTNPRNRDTDDDGMPDGWEVQNMLNPLDPADALDDPDGDDLNNFEEYDFGLRPTNPRKEDTDSDGMPDGWEVRYFLNPILASDALRDDDLDGLSNVNEYIRKTNPRDFDTDDDGMPDGWEVQYGLDPLSNTDKDTDLDSDGLSNFREYQNGTIADNPDTDSDGMKDGWEVLYGFDPKSPADAALDADGDGLSNLQEFNAGSDPKKTDTDGDGMPDKWEVDYAFNPANASDAALDADSDGLTNLREFQLGTDPRKADTDSDGMPDKWEVDNGLDPKSVADVSLDADGDGLTNLREFQLGTNPKDSDTDDDRLSDGDEVGVRLTNPLLPDTDNDGMTDYQEVFVFRTDPLSQTPIPDRPSFVTVGDPSNPDEDSEGVDSENAGIGYVAQAFDIGLTEVTNLMYAKFLNAMAKSDAIFGLYSAEMGSSPRGGIQRTGINGSYVYTVKRGFETRPVNYVSVFDAMRYCNWLHNDMPATGVPNASTTEDGAYKLDGANRPEMVRRSFGAKYFLPDQDEWHKAAYYDPVGPSGASQDYWIFADRSTAGPGGNFGAPRNKPVGTSSDASHYGTFDQDGNIREWLDASLTGSSRMAVGGGGDISAVSDDPGLVMVTRKGIDSEDVLAEKLDLGFRVARAIAPVNPAPVVRPRMVAVGLPGNLPDTNGKGSVAYPYQIGVYEVTNEEYAVFLNAVAKSDSPYLLYDTQMATDPLGGIIRSGAPGSYAYTVKDGRASRPVNFITVYNAMRYCNWLHNGAQTGGDTESGAYRLLGNLPPDTTAIPRNFGARYFLPDEDEWHKAAYYDSSALAAATGNYWNYAVRSDNATLSQLAVRPSAGLVNVDQPGVPSFFGTFGQNGNASEWTEEKAGGLRLVLGGSFASGWSDPAGAMSLPADPQERTADRGFRIAARADAPVIAELPPDLVPKGTKQQKITFNLAKKKRFGSVAFKISAKSNSKRKVSFYSSDPSVAVVSSGPRFVYVMLRGSGTVKITAFEQGDDVWAPAEVTRTLQVLPRKATVVP